PNALFSSWFGKGQRAGGWPRALPRRVSPRGEGGVAQFAEGLMSFSPTLPFVAPRASARFAGFDRGFVSWGNRWPSMAPVCSVFGRCGTQSAAGKPASKNPRQALESDRHY